MEVGGGVKSYTQCGESVLNVSGVVLNNEAASGQFQTHHSSISSIDNTLKANPEYKNKYLSNGTSNNFID